MSIIENCPDRCKSAADDPVDLRETLYNDCPIGPAGVIQVPVERITRLSGFMLDLDRKLLVAGNALFSPADDPRQFCANIEPVLSRHPLVRHAEIRASGTSLHAIVWLNPPVEFKSSGDQKRWAVIVRAVQASLPSDPNAPGITGLTRPIGSINSKNGATVEVLRPGEPIDPVRVVEFVAELADAPFRGVAMILLGADAVEPCPLCRAPGSRLGVLDRVGKCYGCGKVTLEMLFDAIFVAPSVEADDADAADDTPEPEPSIVMAPKSKGRRKTTTPKRQTSKSTGRK